MESLRFDVLNIGVCAISASDNLASADVLLLSAR